MKKKNINIIPIYDRCANLSKLYNDILLVEQEKLPAIYPKPTKVKMPVVLSVYSNLADKAKIDRHEFTALMEAAIASDHELVGVAVRKLMVSLKMILSTDDSPVLEAVKQAEETFVEDVKHYEWSVTHLANATKIKESKIKKVVKQHHDEWCKIVEGIQETLADKPNKTKNNLLEYAFLKALQKRNKDLVTISPKSIIIDVERVKVLNAKSINSLKSSAFGEYSNLEYSLNKKIIRSSSTEQLEHSFYENIGKVYTIDILAEMIRRFKIKHNISNIFEAPEECNLPEQVYDMITTYKQYHESKFSTKNTRWQSTYY